MAAALRDWLENWIGTRADDDVLRTLFTVMLTATLSVLALDYQGLADAAIEQRSSPMAAPSVTPQAEPLPGSGAGIPAPLRTPDSKLQQPMSFDLQSNGRLVSTGTIMPGTAKSFAEEVGKRGGYVRTVVLHSPGGSLTDALSMGRLIREKKFATAVENGKYCASACPLLFAGGVDRRAGAKAAIGVHRAISIGGDSLGERDGMADGQRVSALAQTYLREMGVDLAVWIHAMETPNDRLYYFKPIELLDLKLATEAGEQAAAQAKTKS